MKMENDVLMILRIPPPFGGGEIVSEILYNEIKNDFRFLLIKRKNHSKKKQSKLSITSIFQGLLYIIKIIFNIIKYKPKTIYIGLPKTYGAFYRNSIIISFANYKKIRVITELHGMSFPFIEQEKGRLLFNRTMNKVYAIRVLSNSIKNYLETNEFKGKIYVIDNGIPIVSKNKIILPEIHKEIRFFTLGTISDAKGFSNVIEVAINLKKNNINFIINVIGEWINETYKIKCNEIIIEHGLIQCFIFHGVKKNEDKWNIINQNHFLLHLTKFDGQPLAIIESFSSSIPVFSTKIGGIPEMIDHGKDGFLVEQNENVTSNIIDILANKINYNFLQENAFEKYNKRFSSSVMSRKIKSMINESKQ